MEQEEKDLNEKIKKLEEQIIKLKEEKEQYLNGWKRARADYLNYLKEEKERLEKFLEIANKELVFKLLPVLDSFKRAEENLSDQDRENPSIKGLLQIQTQLFEILKKEGLQEIETKEGEKFNPEIHEAVGEIERDDLEEGSIGKVIERGYKFKDIILRPVKVYLSSKRSNNSKQNN